MLQNEQAIVQQWLPRSGQREAVVPSCILPCHRAVGTLSGWLNSECYAMFYPYGHHQVIGLWEVPVYHSGGGRMQPWIVASAEWELAIGWGWSWVSLTPRHPDTTGNCKEESGMEGAHRPSTKSPGAEVGSLTCLRLAAIVQDCGGAFCRKLRQYCSVDKGFLPTLHSNSWWEKWSMLVHTVYWFFSVENGCIQPAQGGPETKHFYRKESLEREAYWVNPQGQSRYLIRMENYVLCYITIGHIPIWGVWPHVLGQESGRE